MLFFRIAIFFLLLAAGVSFEREREAPVGFAQLAPAW